VRHIAIIPARGGSKGIPNKNLILFQGIPLLVHTIRHAKASNVIDDVYVSTQDPEIATVAWDAGAFVVNRPEEHCLDFSRSEEAIEHVLDRVAADKDDVIYFYQCTSPLRRPDDTELALGLMEANGWDSLFSACATQQFVWRQGVRAFYDYRYRPMRQDKIPVILENGSFYISRAWCYMNYHNRLWGNIGYYLQPWLYGFEVDDMEDLEALTRLE